MAKKVTKKATTKKNTLKTAMKAAKAKAEIVKETQVPVRGEQVNSSIDMRLSKQDLIEMAIEDLKDNARAEVDAAQEAYNDAQESLEIEYEKLVKSAREATKTLFAEELKVYEHLSLRDAGQSYSEFFLLDSGKVVDHTEMYELQKKRENRNKNFHSLQLTSGFGLSAHSDGKSKFVVSLNINLKMTKKQAEAHYAPLLELSKDKNVKLETLSQANKRYVDIANSSGKAKAQLTRRILESSTDGKAVLENMASVKVTIAALAAPKK